MINHVRLRTNMSVKIGFRSIDTAPNFSGGRPSQSGSFRRFVGNTSSDAGGEKEGKERKETDQE